MSEINFTGDALWGRIERAVQKVKDRLRRVVDALEAAHVDYAVVGGNAVQLWVAQADESVVRNTRDVNIAIKREDLEAARQALESRGFIYRHSAGVTMFLDGPAAKARDAVDVVFAGEKVRADYPEPVPSIDDYQSLQDMRAMNLESLVRMKLTSHRLKDRVHLLDMISVGLIDETWLARFEGELRERLQVLLENPDA